MAEAVAVLDAWRQTTGCSTIRINLLMRLEQGISRLADAMTVDLAQVLDRLLDM
jgi:hypothetical protein